VIIVPETKAVSDLLTEFQTRRRHLAVVVDEFGSITGLVTVEDALEQIVGEVEDEFDVHDSSMQKLSSGTLMLYGNVTLLDLETQMGWHLPHDGGVETLAGFLLVYMQKIPKVGDSLVHDGRRFTVASMEDRRITQVRVEPLTMGEPDGPTLPGIQAAGMESVKDNRSQHGASASDASENSLHTNEEQNPA